MKPTSARARIEEKLPGLVPSPSECSLAAQLYCAASTGVTGAAKLGGEASAVLWL
ncbi:MAG: hypothetical protein WA434_02395 [Candidatus Acidiferrales bacterium]